MSPVIILPHDSFVNYAFSKNTVLEAAFDKCSINRFVDGNKLVFVRIVLIVSLTFYNENKTPWNPLNKI